MMGPDLAEGWNISQAWRARTRGWTLHYKICWKLDLLSYKSHLMLGKSPTLPAPRQRRSNNGTMAERRNIPPTSKTRRILPCGYSALFPAVLDKLSGIDPSWGPRSDWLTRGANVQQADESSRLAVGGRCSGIEICAPRHAGFLYGNRRFVADGGTKGLGARASACTCSAIPAAVSLDFGRGRSCGFGGGMMLELRRMLRSHRVGV